MSLAESNKTKVLLTVLHLHTLHGRCSVGDVARGAGLALSTTHKHLRRLEAEGFLDWPKGTHGTITPNVEEAVFG